MFTDVVASTALATRQGDRRAREVLAAHRKVVRSELTRHGGREVDATGDGFFVAFDCARTALRCAGSIHAALSEQRAGVHVRIGLNAGDVLVGDGGVSGAAVSGAARLVSLAAPGEVLVGEVVKLLAAPMPGVTFQDRGPHDLRGFDEPVRVFEVKERPCLDVAIAEDNLLVREGVRSVLSLYGDIRVVECCSDVDAIRSAVARRVPDVVVTDIRMPPTGTDEGVQLAEWLHEHHPQVGVVALSQHDEPAHLRRLLTAGAAGRAFLLKESIAGGDTLHDAIRTVASGGTFLDPAVAASPHQRTEEQ